MQKILFISGSARNGNCKEILETIQKNFWLEYSTDVVFIRDFNLKPCLGCGTCAENEHHLCVSDDKSDILLDKVLGADIVVLATPNYFYNLSSLTKNFIDKTYSLYHEKNFLIKKFIYIYVGEDDEANTKKYLDNAMYGFTICHEVKVLGSYAFSAANVGEFNNPTLAQSTIQDIVSTIRENLIEE